MDNTASSAEWLRRAQSSFAQARIGRTNPEIALEDLCYNAQQAAEKAIKALFIAHGIAFPRTHNISQLLTLIDAAGILVPADLDGVDALTEYAVTTRYPGEWEPIEEAEYEEALSMAEKVLAWVRTSLASL